MTTKIVNGKIVFCDRIEEGVTLVLRDGIIASVGDDGSEADKIVDADGAYVLAGFVDIHCHGGNGYDFMDSTPDQMRKISEFHLSHGTTTLVATTMTDTWENIEAALSRFAELGDDRATLHGVHLEGPWFSPSQCGAQSIESMSRPTPEKLKELVEKYPFIERFSIAPDVDDNYATGKVGVSLGRVISIGHTDADFDTTLEAADNGYSLVTHLYSGMKGVVRVNAYRVAGAVEASLYDDRLKAEVIADGKHLPAGLLKLILKCKGPDRICLVTDAMRGAGLADGSVTILGRRDGGAVTIIEDGVAKLPDRASFAGSVATTDRLFRTIIELGGASVVEASRMLSATPSDVMGYTDRGRISEGLRADLVIMDENYNIKYTFLKGKINK